MRDLSQKNLGIRLRLEIAGKINTHTSGIFPCHRKIQPFASRITFNSMNVEDNRRVYEAKDAFLWLPTSFGKSVRYEVLSFACSTINEVSWVQCGCSYTVILLVSLLVSLTIAKFNGLSVHCSVVAHFSALYVYYFRISCPYIIAHGQSTSTLQFYGNIAETAAHAQAVDTRPSLSSQQPGYKAIFAKSCIYTCSYS